MTRAFAMVVVLCTLVSSTRAETPSFCSSTHRGSGPVDGRFMGVPYGMLMWFLAEKYCGAPVKAPEPKFLGFAEREGCGPDTEIYREFQETLVQMKAADLRFMAADGDPRSKMSLADARKWAKFSVDQLGGCAKLVEYHDNDD